MARVIYGYIRHVHRRNKYTDRHTITPYIRRFCGTEERWLVSKGTLIAQILQDQDNRLTLEAGLIKDHSTKIVIYGMATAKSYHFDRCTCHVKNQSAALTLNVLEKIKSDQDVIKFLIFFIHVN